MARGSRCWRARMAGVSGSAVRAPHAKMRTGIAADPHFCSRRLRRSGLAALSVVRVAGCAAAPPGSGPGDLGSGDPQGRCRSCVLPPRRRPRVAVRSKAVRPKASRIGLRRPRALRSTSRPAPSSRVRPAVPSRVGLPCRPKRVASRASPGVTYVSVLADFSFRPTSFVHRLQFLGVSAASLSASTAKRSHGSPNRQSGKTVPGPVDNEDNGDSFVTILRISPTSVRGEPVEPRGRTAARATSFDRLRTNGGRDASLRRLLLRRPPIESLALARHVPQ